MKTDEDSNSGRRWWTATLLLTGITFVIMLIILPRTNITSDETKDISKASGTFVQSVLNDDLQTNPPLRLMYLNTILRLTDKTGVVRLSFAIFGTAMVFLVSLVGKRYYNNTAGILASLIVILNAELLRQCLMLRGFAMMYCFILAAAYFYYDVYFFNRKIIPYIICSSLALYSHYLAGIVFLTQIVLWTLKTEKIENRKKYLILSGFALAALPAAIMVLCSGRVQPDYPFFDHGSKSPLFYFGLYLVTLTGSYGIGSYLMGMIIFAAAVTGFFLDRKIIPAILCVSIPAVILSGIISDDIRIREDYFRFLVPFTILAASGAFVHYYSKGKKRFWLVLILISIIIGGGNQGYYRIIKKHGQEPLLPPDRIRNTVFTDEVALWDTYGFLLKRTGGTNNIKKDYIDARASLPDGYEINAPGTDNNLLFFTNQEAFAEYIDSYEGHFGVVTSSKRPTYDTGFLATDCSPIGAAGTQQLWECYSPGPRAGSGR